MSLGPIETRFLPHADFELAEQTTNDVPATMAADFDVALPIHADDCRRLHARFGQIALVQFVLGHNFLQRGTGHFDEGHGESMLLEELEARAIILAGRARFVIDAVDRDSTRPLQSPIGGRRPNLFG